MPDGEKICGTVVARPPKHARPECSSPPRRTTSHRAKRSWVMQPILATDELTGRWTTPTSTLSLYRLRRRFCVAKPFHYAPRRRSSFCRRAVVELGTGISKTSAVAWKGRRSILGRPRRAALQLPAQVETNAPCGSRPVERVRFRHQRRQRRCDATPALLPPILTVWGWQAHARGDNSLG